MAVFAVHFDAALAPRHRKRADTSTSKEGDARLR